MKKLIKLASVLLMLSASFAFGQNYMNQNAQELINETGNNNGDINRKVKFCIKTSCCGVGIFSVEIWSETTCSYIYSTKGGKNTNITVINLKTANGEKYKNSELTLPNDIVVPGNYENENGEADVDVLKAGKYQIIDGQLAFTPVTQRLRITCIVSTHDGTIFGNPYHFTTGICAIYLWPIIGANNNGFLTLDISDNKLLLDLARKHNNTLRFDQDLIINNPTRDQAQAKDVSKIVIKAGTYIVNDDNKIYIQNYELK